MWSGEILLMDDDFNLSKGLEHPTTIYQLNLLSSPPSGTLSASGKSKNCTYPKFKVFIIFVIDDDDADADADNGDDDNGDDGDNDNDNGDI
jgi:hypothetical protein